MPSVPRSDCVYLYRCVCYIVLERAVFPVGVLKPEKKNRIKVFKSLFSIRNISWIYLVLSEVIIYYSMDILCCTGGRTEVPFVPVHNVHGSIHAPPSQAWSVGQGRSFSVTQIACMVFTLPSDILLLRGRAAAELGVVCLSLPRFLL